MTNRIVISIAIICGITIGLPSQALAQTTPNFPINNYQSVLGDLSAFMTNPNTPIGGLLDQHARWHHPGIPGGRRIAAGQPGSGTEFLTFHRDFVVKVYDAENGSGLAADFNQVTPWTRVPDSLRALPSYNQIAPGSTVSPATAESRLLNANPDFATEDELGIYMERELHNWIHSATTAALNDNVTWDPHHSPQSTHFYQIHGFINYLWAIYFPQSCQIASNYYGIDAGQTFGFAPERVKQWWRDNSCNTSSGIDFRCQKISNLYNTQANISFGGAPNDVQSFWRLNNCNTQPRPATNTCTAISNTFGTWASVALGVAPTEVRSVWTANSCNTAPDLCQRASDIYGIIAGRTFGNAPTDVQYFWRANNCNTQPRWRIVIGLH